MWVPPTGKAVFPQLFALVISVHRVHSFKDKLIYSRSKGPPYLWNKDFFSFCSSFSVDNDFLASAHSHMSTVSRAAGELCMPACTLWITGKQLVFLKIHHGLMKNLSSDARGLKSWSCLASILGKGSPCLSPLAMWSLLAPWGPCRLPLPFCLQHGWLKAAKQVKFIASHAMWPHPCHPGWVATPRARMIPGWAHWDGAPQLGGPWRLHQKTSQRACVLFFILEYVITEALVTSLIGPSNMSVVKPSGIGCARHSKVLRSSSLRSSFYGFLCPTKSQVVLN